VAEDQDFGIRKVDPRTESGAAARQLLASKDFGGIAESQEIARQQGQKSLFKLIAFCIVSMVVFDFALLLPWVHLDAKVIGVVNTALAGGAGVLGLVTRYILAPYRASRPPGTSRKK